MTDENLDRLFSQEIPTRPQDRIRLIHELAACVLEDSGHADRWMHSSVRALGSRRPIDVAGTPEGFELCRALLGRLEHGVSS